MHADPVCVENNRGIIEKLLAAYDHAYRELKKHWKEVCCAAGKTVRNPALKKVLICERPSP